MKRIVVLLSLLALSYLSYAQDDAYKDWKKCEKECDNLRNENVKLKNLIKEKNVELKDVKRNFDIIVKSNNTKESELKGIEDKIKEEQRKNNELSLELKTLQTQNSKLVKEFIWNKDKEEAKRDSLRNLNARIKKVKSDRKSQKDNLSKNIKQAETEGREKGESAGVKDLYAKYINKDFDALVIMRPYDFVTKDSIFLAKDKKKIDDMITVLKYNSAKLCLNQKYNEKKVAKALEDINYVIEKNPASDGAKKLKESLIYYKDINDAFVKLVQKMDDNNKKAPGETDKQIADKKSGFLKMIGNFINRNVFDFEEYPYIGQKLVKIMEIKSSDEGVNTNVGYLLK